MKISFQYIFNDKDTKLIKQLEGISMNTTMYIQEVCHMHKLNSIVYDMDYLSF